MSCGQQQTQASVRAPASKLAPKRSASLKGPTRVLVLADQDSDGTTALLSALSGAGYAVTERPPPEYTWDGVTPMNSATLAGSYQVSSFAGLSIETRSVTS